VHFKEQWTAVSPGQAAVLYDEKNEVVLAGGVILKDDDRLAREMA